MKEICKDCKFYEQPLETSKGIKKHSYCKNDKLTSQEEWNKDKNYPLNDKIECYTYFSPWSCSCGKQDYSTGFKVGENFGCIHWRKIKK